MRLCVHAALLSVTLSMCACNPMASQYRLQMAAENFNESLRWQRFDSAALYVSRDKQGEFLKSLIEEKQHARLTHVAIQNIVIGSGEGSTTAQVYVLAEGYGLPSTATCERLVEQRWVYAEGHWQIAEGFASLPLDCAERAQTGH